MMHGFYGDYVLNAKAPLIQPHKKPRYDSLSSTALLKEQLSPKKSNGMHTCSNKNVLRIREKSAPKGKKLSEAKVISNFPSLAGPIFPSTSPPPST